MLKGDIITLLPHFNRGTIALTMDLGITRRKLLRSSSAALALSKSILDRTFELTDEQVFALGREAQAICYTTSEHQDAVAAFLKKKR